jgi:hypothetical protein
MNKFKLLIIGFILVLVLIALSLIKGLISGDPEAYIFLFLMLIVVMAYSKKKKK